ncbi:hypothetical protein P872_05195 [Rhodonellum psychrophilum GCM71 = DSM 17998]|uniref:Uncharacterized protein n=1 Tax=Rhodonellum psychrophilum GCM71 = DSM 17998 TaxID=1123057 RepID=U5C263_9BACT|nr:hypothetical protein P872_05195 [Rhodonellum psychrophilum GCM71 = DSM 17998]
MSQMIGQKGQFKTIFGDDFFPENSSGIIFNLLIISKSMFYEFQCNTLENYKFICFKEKKTCYQ